MVNQVSFEIKKILHFKKSEIKGKYVFIMQAKYDATKHKHANIIHYHIFIL